MCSLQVGCLLHRVPPEVCALTQLELLDLSQNMRLIEDGCAALGNAPLQRLRRCRFLDLTVEELECTPLR